MDSGAITNQKEGVNRVRRLPLEEGCRKARPGMWTAMSPTTKSGGQQSSTTSFEGCRKARLGMRTAVSLTTKMQGWSELDNFLCNLEEGCRKAKLGMWTTVS